MSDKAVELAAEDQDTVWVPTRDVQRTVQLLRNLAWLLAGDNIILATVRAHAEMCAGALERAIKEASE